MNVVVIFFLVVFFGCLLASISVWSKRPLLIRSIAVLLLGFIAAAGQASLKEWLGRPALLSEKDLSSNKFGESATVIAASIEQGEAIYLWLRLDYHPEPKYYKMAWQEKMGNELKEVLEQSQKNNTDVTLEFGYEKSLDSDQEFLFYEAPRERLPLKPPPTFNDFTSSAQK